MEFNRVADKLGFTTQQVGTRQAADLFDSPLLGDYEGNAYYLLYNEHTGPVVIYGES
ncbi:hypothetical protein [Methylomonas sp. LWB]|uniref:hypothetical protein n=1 Tax=Methylomonas sp. LWB TaxID=1905845 RepID=UPI0015872082|nr:hypothetical protein [Methylomonas sp. LWB]